MTNDIKYLFMCLFANGQSLVNYLFKFPARLKKKKLSFLLSYWVFRVLHSGYKRFIRYMICKYFVCFLTMSFKERMFLILMKSNLSKVSLMNWYFDVVTKKSLPNPRSQRFVSYVFFYIL